MKFMAGFLLGAVLIGFTAIAFLPVNIINDVRNWTNSEKIVEDNKSNQSAINEQKNNQIEKAINEKLIEVI